MIDYTRVNVLGKYASLNNFIHRWTAEEKKEAIRGLLMEQGIDLDLMKAEEGMSDVDDFDFICHVALNVGIYEIEKTALLQLDPFRRFGSPMRIAGYFGGKEGYLKAVRELEKELYKVG